ncbi:hypothetical protein M427DRAFT_26805 [Gonapodya prolifera JEL478]|uniref:RING-type domain-containing protein n=1 Tax=Gonapodya prolifera (strain JEL478) TaxID=1344416 RepID=A0A139AZL9_GONPJ|nr:hypothetical protein M427DRAFT_26805 [Gonapodya prolifera JEL478]|eukprot:KXS22169.1 hypothetical protein M427DRAFT_26805 [Gonapodya prolifera JEL478]
MDRRSRSRASSGSADRTSLTSTGAYGVHVVRGLPGSQAPFSEGTSRQQPLTIQLDQPVTNISMSSYGRDVVLASKKGLYIIDLDNPVSNARFLPHISKWDVTDCQWNPHPGRESIIASTSNQTCLIWNTSPSLVEIPTSTSLAPSPLAALKSAPSPYVHSVLSAHTRAISDLNWSPFHPDLILTCAMDAWVYLWDLRTQGGGTTAGSGAGTVANHSGAGITKPVGNWCSWTAGASQVRWNRVNEHIFASSHDKDFRIWDIRKGSLPISLTPAAHTNRIFYLDWCYHSAYDLVTCGQDRAVRLWNVANNSSVPAKSPTTSKAASPSRSDTSSISTTQQRRVAAAPAATLVGSLTLPQPTWRARFSPFGNGLLTSPHGSRDTTVQLWNREDIVRSHTMKEGARKSDSAGSAASLPAAPAPVQSFAGHRDAVREFVMRAPTSINAFSLKDFMISEDSNRVQTTFDEDGESEPSCPEYYQLVTWSMDKTLRLWPVSEEAMAKVGYIRGEKWALRRGFGDDLADFSTAGDDESLQSSHNPKEPAVLGSHPPLSFSLSLGEDASNSMGSSSHVLHRRMRSNAAPIGNRLSIGSSGDRPPSSSNRKLSHGPQHPDHTHDSKVEDRVSVFFGPSPEEEGAMRRVNSNASRLLRSPSSDRRGDQNSTPVFPSFKSTNVDDEVAWCKRVPGVVVEGWTPLGSPSSRMTKRKSALKVEDSDKADVKESVQDRDDEPKGGSRSCQIQMVVRDCIRPPSWTVETTGGTSERSTERRGTLAVVITLHVQFPPEYPRDPLSIQVGRSTLLSLVGREELANRLNQIAYVSAYRRIPAIEPCLRYIFASAPLIFSTAYPSAVLDSPPDLVRNLARRRELFSRDEFNNLGLDLRNHPNRIGDFAFGFLPGASIDWDNVLSSAVEDPLLDEAESNDRESLAPASKEVQATSSTDGSTKLPRSTSLKTLDATAPADASSQVKTMPLAHNVPFPSLCGVAFVAGTGQLYYFKSPIPHPRDTGFLSSGSEEEADRKGNKDVSMPRNYPIYEEYRDFLLQDAVATLSGMGIGEDDAVKCDEITGEVVLQRALDDSRQKAAEPSWMRGLFPEKATTGKQRTTIWSGMLEKVRLVQALKQPSRRPSTVNIPAAEDHVGSQPKVVDKVESSSYHEPRVIFEQSGVVSVQLAHKEHSWTSVKSGDSVALKSGDSVASPQMQRQSLRIATERKSSGLSTSPGSTGSPTTPRATFGQTNPVAIPQTDPRDPPRPRKTGSDDELISGTDNIPFGTVPTPGKSGVGAGIKAVEDLSRMNIVAGPATRLFYESPENGESKGTIIQAGMVAPPSQHSNSQRGSQSSTDVLPRVTLGTVVKVANFEHLLPFSRSLASKYTLSGTDPLDVCISNEAVARKNHRPDLAKLWSSVAIILTRCIPSPVGGTSSDVVGRGRAAFGQRIRFLQNGKLAVDTAPPSAMFWGRVDWRNHPLGRKLIDKIFSRLEVLKDVQTLALLTCVLLENRTPDLLPRSAVRRTFNISDAFSTLEHHSKSTHRAPIIAARAATPSPAPGEMSYFAAFFGLGQKSSSQSQQEKVPPILPVDPTPSHHRFQNITDGRLASSPHTFLVSGNEKSSAGDKTAPHQSGTTPQPSQSGLGLSSLFRYGTTAQLSKPTSSEPVTTGAVAQRTGAAVELGRSPALSRVVDEVVAAKKRDGARPKEKIRQTTSSFTVQRVAEYGEFPDDEIGFCPVEFQNRKPNEDIRSHTILDPARAHIYNEYLYGYASLLHQWGLLQQRSEVLKFIRAHPSSTVEPSDRRNDSPKVVHLCSNCGHELDLDGTPSRTRPTPTLSRPALCSNCNTAAARATCKVCETAVRGLSVYCPVCRHGGHTECMAAWFAESAEQACPTGCGCACLLSSGA